MKMKVRKPWSQCPLYCLFLAVPNALAVLSILYSASFLAPPADRTSLPWPSPWPSPSDRAPHAPRVPAATTGATTAHTDQGATPSPRDRATYPPRAPTATGATATRTDPGTSIRDARTVDPLFPELPTFPGRNASQEQKPQFGKALHRWEVFQEEAKRRAAAREEADLTPPNATKILWMYWEQGLRHLESIANTSDAKLKKYTTDYQCVQAWRALNPGWDVRVLGREDVTRELAPVFRGLDDLDRPERLEPRMRANILRLELLARYGGVYSDTSNCPLARLDAFVWDLATGSTAETSVFAPPCLHRYRDIPAPRFPPDVARCHEARSDGTEASTMYHTADNWFLVSLYPNSTFFKGWLETYHHHLRTKDQLWYPYFLAHCSLTQARMNNAAVDDIWMEVIAREEAREKHVLWNRGVSRETRFAQGRMLRYCADLDDEPGRDLDWYRQMCAFVKKQKSDLLRHYVLSETYLKDVTAWDEGGLVARPWPFQT